MFDGNPIRIASPEDPRLADYRELRDPAARRRIEGDEFFVVEGPVAIERLLSAPHRIRSVLLSEDKYTRMESRLARAASSRDDVCVYVVERALLREIVGFDLHRGAIAAADRLAHPSLAELLRTSRRVAVLEGLNDPENLGAVARSARAFGIDAFVLDPTCIDPYTRRTVRVSMGEILFLPCARATPAEWPEGVATALHEHGFATWAMTPSPDARDIWDLAVPDKVAVVFGAEGPGLSAAAICAADAPVRLPIAPDVDSLNVAAAAAVTFAVLARARLAP